LLNQGAWWKYPLASFWWAHGSKWFSLSRHYLLGNDISPLCS
jgi:hypothetical protein